MKTLKLSKTFLIYYIVVIAFVGLRIMSSLGVFSFISDPYLKSTTTTFLIQICVLFLLPLILYKLFSKQKTKEIFKSFGYRKISFKVIVLTIILGILAYILNIIVASGFSAFLSFFGYEGIRGFAQSSTVTYDTFPKFLLGIVLVAVLPAFCEEFLHRGMLLRGTGSKIGYKRALILSSVLFGLMHLNVEQVFYATVLGLVMGAVSLATNSIWTASIIHFINNAINVYFSYAQTAGLPGGRLFDVLMALLQKISPIQAMIFTFALFAILLFAMIGIFMKLLKQTKYEEICSSYELINSELMHNQEEGKVYSRDDVDRAFAIYMEKKFKDVDSYQYLIFPKQEADQKVLHTSETVFLIGTLILGFLVTLSTFIWGIF